MRRIITTITAIAGLASIAAAQVDQVIPAEQVGPIDLALIRGGDFARGYSSRVDLAVYEVGHPFQTGGDWRSSGVNVYDDIVVGGPYTSNASPLVVNGVAIGFGVPPQSTTDDHLYTRLSFYPNHDNSVDPDAMPYSGTPVTWALDWGAGWSRATPPGSYFPMVTFNGSVTLSSADVFSDGPGDLTCGVKIELFLDAVLTRYANDWQILRRGNLPAAGLTSMPLAVGTSDYFGWFSAATGVTSGDITNAQRSGGTAANNRATYFALQGTGFSCGRNCGTSDFNGDGDFGTDADIETFFACLGGDCCPRCFCQYSDFDGDGDFGTDADIEAFFRVLAGGAC
jgi:hypothetical protein